MTTNAQLCPSRTRFWLASQLAAKLQHQDTTLKLPEENRMQKTRWNMWPKPVGPPEYLCVFSYLILCWGMGVRGEEGNSHIVLNWPTSSCAIIYYTILYYTVQYYIIPYYPILYYAYYTILMGFISYVWSSAKEAVTRQSAAPLQGAKRVE